MNKYAIQDKKGYFWCEDERFGYWSKEIISIKQARVEGSFLWLLPFLWLMKLLNKSLRNNIRLVLIKEREL